MKKEKEPWYKEGLRFNCTQCGKCCTGSPGYVWADEQEIQEMAKFLNVSVEEFVKKYMRKVDGRLALLEDPKNYDCIFLKDRLCQVYGARPKQCRTFPWWHENLSSAKAWTATARRCEGINHPDSKLIPLPDILNNLKYD